MIKATRASAEDWEDTIKGRRGRWRLKRRIDEFSKRSGQRAIFWEVEESSDDEVEESSDDSGSQYVLKAVPKDELHKHSEDEVKWQQQIARGSDAVLEIKEWFWHEDDYLCIVTPLMSGGDLRTLLGQRRLDFQWMEPEGQRHIVELACRIGRDVALALRKAHQQGILHRDIKPENILFSADPLKSKSDDFDVKLADFGVAKRLPQDATAAVQRWTLTEIRGTPVGTLLYMDPAVLGFGPFASQEPGLAYDIFALGAVLYEVLTGRHFLPEVNRPMEQSDISMAGFLAVWAKEGGKLSDFSLGEDHQRLETLVRNMLALTPESRPSAEEVHATLKHEIYPPQGRRVPIEEVHTAAKHKTSFPRGRLASIILLALLVFLIVIGYLIFVAISTASSLGTASTGSEESASKAVAAPPLPTSATLPVPSTAMPLPSATLAPSATPTVPAPTSTPVIPTPSSEARAQTHIDSGNALLERDNLDAAWAEYGEALALVPDHSKALNGQRQVVLRKCWLAMEAAWGHDDDGVIEALECVVQTDRTYRSRETEEKLYATLISKADGLLRTDNRDGAYPILMRAKEFMPNRPEADQRLRSYTPTPSPTSPPPQNSVPTQPNVIRPTWTASQPGVRPTPQPAPTDTRPTPQPITGPAASSSGPSVAPTRPTPGPIVGPTRSPPGPIR